ncbi:hypothetical protein Ae201684P_020313 [Aphanomyces euteiches]|nr:hypothetical protein Ae201684P_020313 [Aphanomyces euteiches]KAH9144508.1 hypothetical protein AeRB84_011561 [Aphanomyces euteiches]
MTAAVHCLRAVEGPRLPPKKISKWLYWFILSFAILKHFVTALYLAAQIIIMVLADASQLRTARAYAINAVIAVFAIVLCLHLGSLVKYITSWKRQKHGKTIAKASRLGSFLVQIRYMATSPRLVLGFNTIELICQSYEAYQLSKLLVDPRLVILYVILVALHAIVVPSFVCMSHTTKTHQLLLGWASSLLSFGLCCLVHFYGLILPLLYYFLVDHWLSRSPSWNARYISYIRYNFVTSLEELVAKTVVQLGSIIALWRLVANVNVAISVRYNTDHGSSSASLRRFTNKRLLTVYWICCIGWGLVLLSGLIGAFSPPCPAVCAARATPLWSRQCHCSYVHVNCHALGLPLDSDVDSLLRADELGSDLLVLQISRFDLSNGISTTTLGQFQSLSFMAIKFTNISSWEATLPSSITFIVVSYGRLSQVPSALQNAPLPPAWQIINRLYLVNLSLSVLPRLDTLDLHYITLAQNNFPVLPPIVNDAKSHNIYVDLSGNSLLHSPWSLLKPGRTVYLCGNPDEIPPDSLDPKLRASYLAKESAMCGKPCVPSCFPHMVGDHECQLVCFTKGCRYDGGDCDEYGLDKAL